MLEEDGGDNGEEGGGGERGRERERERERREGEREGGRRNSTWDQLGTAKCSFCVNGRLHRSIHDEIDKCDVH